MMVHKDLSKSGLIVSVEDGCEKPTIFKGYFGFQCYEICLKNDIILEPRSMSVQSTGLKIRVPPRCIAVVHTAYKPNGCMVEDKVYGPSHGTFELKLRCENLGNDKTEIYSDYRVAHLYLYEISEEEESSRRSQKNEILVWSNEAKRIKLRH